MISFSYCQNNKAILSSATGPITISYLLSLLHKTSCTFVNALLLLFITNFAHSSVVRILKFLILRLYNSLKSNFIYTITYYSLFFISITLYYILFLPQNVHILVRMIQQITVHLPFALHVSLFHHCTSIFPSATPLLGKLSYIHSKECIPFRFSAYGILY